MADRSVQSLFLAAFLCWVVTGTPAAAHIGGTVDQYHYIRITPWMNNWSPQSRAAYAKYEWCKYEFGRDKSVVPFDCEPMGKPGAYYPMSVFDGLLRRMDREQWAEQRVQPIAELVVNVGLTLVTGVVASNLAGRMAIRYVVPRLSSLLAKLGAHYGIVLVGGATGFTAAQAAVYLAKKLPRWSEEALAKNRVQLITSPQNSGQAGSAFEEALVYNPGVLSGQDGIFHTVDEHMFHTLGSVRERIEEILDTADRFLKAETVYVDLSSG
jgi:hypothetical protein